MKSKLSSTSDRSGTAASTGSTLSAPPRLKLQTQPCSQFEADWRSQTLEAALDPPCLQLYRHRRTCAFNRATCEVINPSCSCFSSLLKLCLSTCILSINKTVNTLCNPADNIHYLLGSQISLPQACDRALIPRFSRIGSADCKTLAKVQWQHIDVCIPPTAARVSSLEDDQFN